MATQNYQAPGWVAQGSNTEQGTGPSFSGFGQPAQNSYAAWTVEPTDVTSTYTNPATTQNILLKVFVQTAGFVSKFDVNITTVGAQTHTYFGLYSTAGAQLGVTADATAAWTATGKFTATMVSPVLVATGFYYLLWNQTFSVAPQVSGGPASLVINFNTTAATSFFATAGTSVTPPASITMSSNTPIVTAVPFIALY